jgi:hypothetical protein
MCVAHGVIYENFKNYNFFISDPPKVHVEKLPVMTKFRLLRINY